MTTNDTTQTKQQTEYNFEVKTYNGIEVIFENNSGYFNATHMSKQNSKRWRTYKQTKAWNECKAIYDEFIAPQACGRKMPYEKISFEPENVANQWRGEYVHPKLIHFVAEWCSKIYAFKVSELMDSINENIHEQIKRENIEDKPENTKQLFLSSVATICDIMTKPIGQAEFEEQFSWGYRDINTQGCEYFAVSDALNTLLKSHDYIKSHDKQLFDFMEERRMNEIQKLEQRKNKPKSIIDRLEFLKSI